jgi:U3 small nucleolar RNA-associated protein 23
LRARLGVIPGVPIIYVNKVVLVLEPPSSQSKETSLEIEATKEALTPLEAEVLQKVTRKTKGVNIVGGESAATDDSTSVPTQQRKKRKATSANPLASKQASQVRISSTTAYVSVNGPF